jgi:hypothetical protein
VIGPTGRDLPRSSFDPAAIRAHLADVADAVAVTEDRLADTYEPLARTRPAHAERLYARAARARQYAMVERDRAAGYRSPLGKDHAPGPDPGGAGAGG